MMRVASHSSSGWAGSGKSTSRVKRRSGYARCSSTTSELLAKTLDFENSMRGSLKVFGLRIGTVTPANIPGAGAGLVAEAGAFSRSPNPCCASVEALIAEFERLDRLCRQLARRDPVSVTG